MRRTLAVVVAALALSISAACRDGGSGGENTAESTPAATAATSAAGASKAAAHPACAEVVQLIADTRAKTQQEIAKAATASDADLERARQTVKQLYTSAAAATKSAADKAVDPALKSALQTISTEATKIAASLDSGQRASTALALMDTTKLTAAAQQVQQICGQA